MDLHLYPSLFFPGKIFVLDDDKGFLKNINFQLRDQFELNTFHEPEELLDKLGEDKFFDNIREKVVRDFQSDELATIEDLQAIDYKQLFNIIFNKEKYNQPTVVLVDYMMPTMSGLDFCRRVTNRFVKKILLTGVADNAVAVSAFNEGIIDRFVTKTNIDYLEDIKSAIKLTRLSYFLEVSEYLIPSNLRLVNSISSYTDLVKKWIEHNKISEYVTVSKSGCLFGKDGNNAYHWMLVNTEDDNKVHLEILENYGILSKFSMLDKCKKQVCLMTEENKRLSPAEWNNFVFDVSDRFSINNKEYFCSYGHGDLFSMRLDQYDRT